MKSVNRIWMAYIVMLVITIFALIISPEVRTDFLEFFISSDVVIENKKIEFRESAEIEELDYSSFFFSKSYKVKIKFYVEEREFNEALTISEVEYNRLLSLENIEIQGEMIKNNYENCDPKYWIQKIRLLYPK
ncbi:MAG: hypothetical protein JXR88_03680 [Clostridia bacterium]|nr:hypothetical protein [Clostridia bacterium]